MKKPRLLLPSALLLSLALTACGGQSAPAPSAAPTVTPAPVESAVPADATASATPAESAVPESAALYVPGTYTGVGEAYNGPITLDVEVSDTAILSVTVVSHSDSEGVIGKCTDNLLSLMIQSNTADVAPISGATLTSDGYKAAVRDALTQAKAH